MDKKQLTQAVSIVFLNLILMTNQTYASPSPASPEMERCYGVAKKGMNDCQTATASCAGSSTQDKQRDAFIFLSKGICNRLAEGKLKPESK